MMTLQTIQLEGENKVVDTIDDKLSSQLRQMIDVQTQTIVTNQQRIFEMQSNLMQQQHAEMVKHLEMICSLLRQTLPQGAATPASTQAAVETAESELKRLAEEAQKQRAAQEAELKRLAQEAETKRLAAEAELARLAQEAETLRLAEEKRLADELEQKRLALEEEQKKA
ncbi:MAG: hypothetical protein K2X81_07790, partial [Candidatus Obscuribacterales bacterium]|nr:hypothetical protein [Candidatus Obscuribacterales bacterium]